MQNFGQKSRWKIPFLKSMYGWGNIKMDFRESGRERIDFCEHVSTPGQR